LFANGLCSPSRLRDLVSGRAFGATHFETLFLGIDGYGLGTKFRNLKRLTTGFARGNHASTVFAHFKLGATSRAGNADLASGLNGDRFVAPLGNHEILAANRTGCHHATILFFHLKCRLAAGTMDFEHAVTPFYSFRPTPEDRSGVGNVTKNRTAGLNQRLATLPHLF
jgi:hypothetical protein